MVYDEILVNDIVEIDIKMDNIYPNYYDWLRLYDRNDYILSSLEETDLTKNCTCRVVWKGPHSWNPTQLFLVEDLESKKVYLLNGKGIVTYRHTKDSYDNRDEIIQYLLNSLVKYDKELFNARQEICGWKDKVNQLKISIDKLFDEEENYYGIRKRLYTYESR